MPKNGKFYIFFTKFKIKDFSLRTQLLPPPHSLPNMSGRFYARNEADWTAGKNVLFVLLDKSWKINQCDRKSNKPSGLWDCLLVLCDVF